jgi:hypothetical protein
MLLFLLLLGLSVGVVQSQPPARLLAQETPDADVDAPNVIETLPADGASDVQADSVITVIFDQPMVPLATDSELTRRLSQSVLFFEPPVLGEGEWINTSIYLFRPSPPLQSGIRYTITIGRDTYALNRQGLAEAFIWSFDTTPPSIASVTPEGGTRAAVALDAPVTVTFNQPMHAATVENAFSLVQIAPTESGSLPGAFTWSDDGTQVTFQPDEPLALDATYRARLEADTATGAGGGDTLAAYDWTFMTYPLPTLVQTSPFDGEMDARPYGGITLFFASPMNIDTLAERVRIEPEPWREFDSYWSDWDNSYTLSFPTEPSTDYTITILPGMEDIYGNVTTEERVIRYRTLPYDPELRLRAPYGVGYLNASAEQTRVFMTHRNVSQIDLALYRVPMANFIGALNQTSYYPARELPSDAGMLIREWSIPSVAPENINRYELLNLGEGGGTLNCPGALTPRVRVGDLVVVTSDPDPVRARADASADAEIVTLLYRDYAMPITGGPVCDSGILWWEVELREGQTAWVAEGVDGEYFIDVRDAAARQAVDVTDASGEALPPGVYLLEISSPETIDDTYRNLRHVLVVGTVNLTMKSSIDSVIVWATDIQTGQIIPDAPIAIYDENLNVIGSARTGADGLVRVPIPSQDGLGDHLTVVMQTDEAFGVVSNSWNSGIRAWSFGYSVNTDLQPHRSYLYTDRPIYRPGQPVHFRGVVRQVDDVTYTPPPFDEVPIVIFNQDYERIHEDTLPLTAFGTFSGTFTLADEASLGEYRLSVIMPEEASDPDRSFFNNTIAFTVAEYRAPEFQVTVSAPEEVISGEPLAVNVESRYFFGGVVGGAAVEWRVIDSPYAFGYDRRYSFFDYDRDSGASAFYEPDGERILEGAGVADERGVFTIDVPTALDEESGSRIFELEATVSDESGQAVSARTRIIVHKGTVYAGVRPDRYVGNQGEEQTVTILTVDALQRQPISAPVMVEVVERRWSSVQERDASGRTVWSYDVEDIPITSGEVTTDADGLGQFAFTPPNGGVYKIEVTTADGLRASQYMWVAGREYVAWRQQNSNRIELIADSDSYAIGETAEILIASPFQGETQALVTVERGDVLFSEVITLATNSTIYRVPITEDYTPNVFVNVLIVKGVDESNPVASFRAGTVRLGVENTRKQITLDIQPNTEQAGPGDTVTYTVRATDYRGEPVQAEVGVGLTDLAVLTLANPNSDPLLTFFYGQQGLGVLTSTPLTINVDQDTQTILDTVKGGGGGFGEGGIFDIREEFIDTPYWNAELTTDADGMATFDVVLPDNLTTWRLDARAVTSGADGDMLVGQTTVDLISTKPVLIRPVTPRFAVVDDEVVLAAVVNNNTDVDLSARVSLQASGVTLSDDTTQTVTIPAGGRTRVEWRVTVEDVEALDLTFFVDANDGQYTDASKPPLGQGDARTIPVYRYSAPITVATAGSLDESGTREEQIILPPEVDTTRGDLVINLDPSLASATVSSLDYLENYPHLCIEQTVSRFLPNMMTVRALTTLGIDNRDLQRRLDIQVGYALQRLSAEQKASGGWGWFLQSPADNLVTAYALIGLYEAQREGYPIDGDMIERAVNYLRANYIIPDRDTPTWELNRQAFVLYALARAGDPDNGRMARLYDLRESISIYAKALLAMAFDLSGADERSRIDTLLSDIVNSASLGATGISWTETLRDHHNWDNDTRTTAIALMALNQLNPDSALIPNVVRWLMAARTTDRWETTQETAWAVMALTDFMVSAGSLQRAYGYEVTLNERLLAGSGADDASLETMQLAVPVAELLRDEANRLLFERSAGAGTLYYTAHLEVYQPVQSVEPVNAGIVVERRYTNEAGEIVTSARVGELIQARLTIIVPQLMFHVVIEDPIPAGADAVDPNLLTSQQIGTQPEINPADPLRFGWGWWWFPSIEFRDEMVVLVADYLPAGAYEFVYTIRPGLPGTYNVIPPTGYQFYFPEVYGRGAGSLFTIEP